MKTNKITIKVIVSYVLLFLVSVVAGYVIFKEIQKLSHQEKINQEEIKLYKLAKSSL